MNVKFIKIKRHNGIICYPEKNKQRFKHGFITDKYVTIKPCLKNQKVFASFIYRYNTVHGINFTK